ncbi:hypothetical protein, partial [uncultured Mycobacterium sp.]|uniref:hypothetical protein n=1 Tax=uncultured Mycobacterium sp. TaxID=171292 RepID=UPI0035CC4D79
MLELAVEGAEVPVDSGVVLTLGDGVVGAPPPDVCRSAIMIATANASTTRAVPMTSTAGRRYQGTAGRRASAGRSWWSTRGRADVAL